MLRVQVALASVSIFGDFATNRAGNAAGGEAAQVALRQLLQPASILSFQGILPCKQQDQWRRDQDPRISGYVTRIAGSKDHWRAGWLLDLWHSRPCRVLQNWLHKSQV